MTFLDGHIMEIGHYVLNCIASLRSKHQYFLSVTLTPPPFCHKGALCYVLSPVRVNCMETFTPKKHWESCSFFYQLHSLGYILQCMTPRQHMRLWRRTEDFLHMPANKFKLYIFYWHFLTYESASNVTEEPLTHVCKFHVCTTLVLAVGFF